MNVKLLHTADLQLGMPFRHLGAFGHKVRAGQMETLDGILELGRKEGVDALLIAGDLFHSNNPSASLVEEVLAKLKRTSYPIVWLPGNHDHAGPGSVYQRPAFEALPEHIHLFRTWEPATVRLGPLAVHARAPQTRKEPLHPLEGLERDLEAAVNVAMAHGTLAIPEKHDPADYQIEAREVAESGMDYVALGHWHTAFDASQGEVTAWYPGAPETTDFAEGDRSGQVLLVTLGRGRKPKVEPRRVGRYRWHLVEADLAVHPPLEGLRELLRPYAAADRIVRLRLGGLLEPGRTVDPLEIHERLGEAFGFLEVVVGRVTVRPEDVEGLFAPDTIGAAFVRLVGEAMREGAGEERDLWQEVLVTGAAYLAGPAGREA